MRRPSCERHQQRRRAARSLVAERLHLGDREAQLRLHRRDDRSGARPGEIQVCGIAPSFVRHGEGLVGREQAEDDERHAEAKDDRVQRCERVGRTEVHASEGNEHGDDCREDAGAPPHGTCRREARHHRTERDRERCHAGGREVVDAAGRCDEHRHRRTWQLDTYQRPECIHQHQRAEGDGEMTPSAEEDQDEAEREPERDDPGRGPEPGERLGDRNPEAGTGADERVEHVRVRRLAGVQLADHEPEHDRRDQHDHSGAPPRRTRQRGWLA